ncbi:MAG TPA: glycosyltransferase family 2 protein [Candidatus Bathyarchaeia archaeon]|nr:glycosyltransferase family 2 protein [Candidatus Bathyarchaeia archaeon]
MLTKMQTDGMLLSAVVPMFNEEPTVGNIIARLKAVLEETNLRYEIIVVDDYSKDNSVEAAGKYHVKVYRLKQHMGKGYALRAGFAKAKGGIIATIDSDGSHRPEELPLLLNPILRREADLVIGSRFSTATSATSRRNQAGNRLFNTLIHMLTRNPISDSQSGYRVITAKVLRSLNLKSGEYEIESEMLVKTVKNGYRIKEVPISFEQRTYGTSHIDPFEDGFKILMSIVSAYLRS